ncbi:MAG: anti-sigma factor [Vulcanimicrobiota bacterium]
MRLCNDIRRLLPAFSEDDLEADETQQVEAHLEKCAECQHELDLLIAAWEALDAWEGLEPSPTFRAQVWEKLRHEPVKTGWGERLEGWFGIRLAAGASMLITGFLVGSMLTAPPAALEETPSPAAPVSAPVNLARGQSSPLDADLLMTLSAPRIGRVSTPLLDVADQAWDPAPEVEFVSDGIR